jgi:hypothetical protein
MVHGGTLVRCLRLVFELSGISTRPFLFDGLTRPMLYVHIRTGY